MEYSFIDAKIESSSFAMHPVLHQLSFYALEKEKANMSWLAMIVVASAAPSEITSNYFSISRRLLPRCDRIFPLLKHRIQERFDTEIDLASLSYACHELAELYSNQGKTKEAEVMYLRTLTGYERIFDVEHMFTLDLIKNLGNLYINQDKMKEAEEMYLRALSGYEKTCGVEHTSTLNIVSNIEALYAKQGKMKKAEEMFLRALIGKEKAWDVEHTSTLETVNN